MSAPSTPRKRERQQPEKPVLPEQPDPARRPNRPIGPGAKDDHPIDGPPDEHARREEGPHARDTL